jgi:hypothetical protein
MSTRNFPKMHECEKQYGHMARLPWSAQGEEVSDADGAAVCFCHENGDDASDAALARHIVRAVNALAEAETPVSGHPGASAGTITTPADYAASLLERDREIETLLAERNEANCECLRLRAMLAGLRAMFGSVSADRDALRAALQTIALGTMPVIVGSESPLSDAQAFARKALRWPGLGSQNRG